jgi:hypothetical protein
MAGRVVVSTLNNDTGVLATQNGMTGIAKAWVYFTGTTGTINGSFNVSSVTRSGTGTYSLSFTTAMPNANYAITQCMVCSSGGGINDGMDLTSAPTTTGIAFQTGTGGTALDATYGYLAFFSS